MSWKQTGSIADRLRALQISDSLLIKNDPMAASMGQQPPMNTPGPNGATMPLTPGEGDYSGVGEAIHQLIDSFDMQGDLIQQVHKAISQQAKAGVVTDALSPIQAKLHKLSGILLEIKAAALQVNEGHSSVTMNDPMQSMSPTGNQRLMAGTASPVFSPQGNMRRM